MTSLPIPSPGIAAILSTLLPLFMVLSLNGVLEF
jgi:hypothetical protein